MRILIASVLSAIVLFFFGFIWWGVLMPTLKPAKVITGRAVVDEMQSSLKESGLYFYPDYGDHSEESTGPWRLSTTTPTCHQWVR